MYHHVMADMKPRRPSVQREMPSCGLQLGQGGNTFVDPLCDARAVKANTHGLLVAASIKASSQEHTCDWIDPATNSTHANRAITSKTSSGPNPGDRNRRCRIACLDVDVAALDGLVWLV